MKKIVLFLALAFVSALTFAQTSSINLESYYVNDYGDSTEQAAQAASFTGEPIVFMGSKVMWLNNLCNSPILKRSGYTKIDADDVSPPVSKWIITQASFVASDNFTPGKVFVRAQLDKNSRLTSCTITATDDNILIDLFCYYWPAGSFDKIEFAKIFKAEKVNKFDAITLTRSDGHLKIIITASALYVSGPSK